MLATFLIRVEDGRVIAWRCGARGEPIEVLATFTPTARMDAQEFRAWVRDVASAMAFGFRHGFNAGVREAGELSCLVEFDAREVETSLASRFRATHSARAAEAMERNEEHRASAVPDASPTEKKS